MTRRSSHTALACDREPRRAVRRAGFIRRFRRGPAWTPGSQLGTGSGQLDRVPVSKVSSNVKAVGKARRCAYAAAVFAPWPRTPAGPGRLSGGSMRTHLPKRVRPRRRRWEMTGRVIGGAKTENPATSTSKTMRALEAFFKRFDLLRLFRSGVPADYDVKHRPWSGWNVRNTFWPGASCSKWSI